MSITLQEPLEKLIQNPRQFTGNKNFAKKIHIYDETLRDGEQMPGVAFSPNQKVEIAKFLGELGVDVILPAFIASSQSDQEAYKKILKSQQSGGIRKEIEIITLARANKKDIDLAAKITQDAGTDLTQVGILILSTTSDLHLKYKLGKVLLKHKGKPIQEWLKTPVSWYRKANIDFIAEHIAYAKKLGFGSIEFAAEDASRGRRDYLIQWAKACQQAGGTRLCFSDTCGVFTPDAVDYYFKKLIRELPDLSITAHFHNDFGLAAINTVQALSHGVTHASITACGLGERAGNGSIHQIVMILKELYGIDLPHFRYEKLWELKKLIEQYSGIPIQPHEPIIGNHVFSHESGIHTAGINIHPAIYQFLDEKIVGGKHAFVYGKHSGKAAIVHILEKNPILAKKYKSQLNDHLIAQVLAEIKNARETKIAEEGHSYFIDRYYHHLNNLGISEAEILDILLRNLN